MRKRGFTKKFDPPVSEVIEHIKNCNGVVSVAARRLNISRSTLYKYLERHPQAMEEIENERETFDDYAENKLFKLIRNGDTKAILFYAETRLKNRGYTRRVEQEITTPDFNVNFIAAPEPKK